MIEVALVGVVTTEPKMNVGKGGKSYCSVSVMFDNAKYMRVTAFNGVAEQMMAVKRMDRAYIEGRITQFEYNGRLDLQVVASFIRTAKIGSNRDENV